jgi:hypothetical protein
VFTADLSPVRPGFDPRSVHVRFVVDKAPGHVFLPVLRIPCQYHSADAPYSSSSTSTCCSYQKDKRAKPGDLRKNKVLSKIAEHWIKRYVHLFIPSMVMNNVVL